MTMPVSLRRLIWLGFVMMLAWCIGFGWFLRVAWRPPTLPPHADGIVVLTGGAERVAVGLHLLQENAAERLLVSGVGHAAEFPELAHRAGVEQSLAPRVTLGRLAVTTRGNALETATWAATYDIRSLIVVTAGYHMPRALTELRQSLPNMVFYPVTVQPPVMRATHDPMTWRLLSGEYTKYLAAEIGISRLANALGIGPMAERNGEHGG